MKKILLFAALIASSVMQAQTTYDAEWEHAITSSSSSAKQYGGVALTYDASTGDIFTIGYFCNTINFGGGNITSTGNDDVYVAKYSAIGAFINAVKLGSASDDIPYSIAFQAGYVFVSWYDGANDVGKVTKLDNTSSSLSTVSTCDLGASVFPRSLFAYGTVNVLIGGSFFDNASFAGGTINLTASNWASCSGCYDSFVASLTASTNTINTAANPNYSTDANEIMAIHCRNNRIYATGYFKGDIKWKTTTQTASGTHDIFIATVALTAAPFPPQRVNVFMDDLLRAGTNASTGVTYATKESGYGIVVDGTAIYITGYLDDASIPTFGSTSFNNGAGAFMARINYSGGSVTTANWVRGTYDCSGAGPLASSYGYGIAVDGNGDLFATGASITGTQLTDGTNTECVGGSGNPGFISHFTSSGTLISGDAINQSANLNTTTEGRAIKVNNCNVITSGFTYNGAANGLFSAGNLGSVNTSNNTGMYLFAFNRDIEISSNQSHCASCASFPVAFSLYGNAGASYSHTWTWNVGAPALTDYNTTTPDYSLASCTGAAVTTYTLTTSSSSCPTNARVTVSVGPAASGQANAGPDLLVCPGGSYTLGTAGQAGLTYSWLNTGYLNNASIAQPTFTTPVSGLPVTYTLTVTDYCGGTSVDYVTVSIDPFCPHRMPNPDLNQAALIAEIYPNPSAGVFNLDLIPSANETTVSFEVTDLAGRVVQQNTFSSAGGTQTIDLSNQGKGIYLLRVVRDGQVEMHRLAVE